MTPDVLPLLRLELADPDIQPSDECISALAQLLLAADRPDDRPTHTIHTGGPSDGDDDR